MQPDCVQNIVHAIPSSKSSRFVGVASQPFSSFKAPHKIHFAKAVDRDVPKNNRNSVSRN